MNTLLLPAIHLSILLGFIIYKTKTPFLAFVAGRHKEVSEGLNRSKVQASLAESKRKDVEQKFANLQTEKEKIFGDWKAREESQIKAIKENSQKILAMMAVEAEQNKKSLEEQVRAQILKKFSDQIINQAEEKIKKGLNAESHKSMADLFVKEVTS